jgi:hypothetical protein
VWGEGGEGGLLVGERLVLSEAEVSRTEQGGRGATECQ